MATNRLPPKVLFVHNGLPAAAHIDHLTDAGLDVRDVQAHRAVAIAIELQPDIIVLDLSADGELTTQLKHHEATKHIPIIALAELAEDRR